MTYLQREQYSQLRLFTCLRVTCAMLDTLSCLGSNKNTQTKRKGGRVCVDRFISSGRERKNANGIIFVEVFLAPSERNPFDACDSWRATRMSRAICHGLAGLSCFIASSSFSISLRLHCWTFLHLLFYDFSMSDCIFVRRDAAYPLWTESNRVPVRL